MEDAAMTNEIIDRDSIEQLFMFDEDGDTFSKEMLSTFKQQCKDTLARMRAALQIKDYTDLSRAGHFLKGSSLTLGSIEVPAICFDIEHSPHATNDQQLLTLDQSITRYFEAVQQYRTG